VDTHIGEFVVAADVVVVAMGCDRDHRLVDQIGDLRSEADETHTGVDQQIAVTPTEVPNVAAHQFDDMRLPQQRQRVVEAPTTEPWLAGAEMWRGWVGTGSVQLRHTACVAE
jgi:hypothetical protein